MSIEDDEWIEDDEVMKEVHANREAFAAEHDHDIRKMGQALRAAEAASGRTYVTLQPRKPRPVSEQALR